MREVMSECPRCGRRTFRKVDSWSGSPDASLDLPCEGGCDLSSIAAVGAGGGSYGRSSLAPLVFAAALIAAPVLGVLEAISR